MIKANDGYFDNIEDLLTYVWKKDVYDNCFWKNIMNDFSTQILKFLISRTKEFISDEPEKKSSEEKNKNLHQIIKNFRILNNYMRWLQIYSLALFSFNESYFEGNDFSDIFSVFEGKESLSEKMDELKFFIFVLKDQLAIFNSKSEKKEVFFYQLYKMSGLYFNLNIVDNFLDKFSSPDNTITDEISRKYNINDKFSNKILNLRIPYPIKEYLGVNFYDWFFSNNSIRPFDFVPFLPTVKISEKLMKNLNKEEQQKFKLKLTKMYIGIKDLSNKIVEITSEKSIKKFLDEPVLLLDAKVFFDMFYIRISSKMKKKS